MAQKYLRFKLKVYNDKIALKLPKMDE